MFNISKETTKKELISIDGVSEAVRRAQGINLSGGVSNSVEFCTNMFKMPQLPTLLEAYRRQADLAAVVAEFKDHIDDSLATAESLEVISEENNVEYEC